MGAYGLSEWRPSLRMPSIYSIHRDGSLLKTKPDEKTLVCTQKAKSPSNPSCIKSRPCSQLLVISRNSRAKPPSTVTRGVTSVHPLDSASMMVVLPQNVDDHEDPSFGLFDRNVPRNTSDNGPHISLPEGLSKNIPHPPKVRKGNHPRRVKVPSLLYRSLLVRPGLGGRSLAGEFLEGVTIRWNQVL